jgi:hypothetical protein
MTAEVMTYDAMAPGRAFRPLDFVVTPADLEAFGRIAGRTCGRAPAGLLAIYARRAYLTEGTMPSGGVMASLQVGFTDALPVGRPLTATAVVGERRERKGRGWVTIDVEFREGVRPFATAQVLGVWPL